MTVVAAIGWKVVPKIVGISPHGIGIAAGYIIGTILLARLAHDRLGISSEDVWNFMTYGVIGVIVGARLFYVVGHYGDVTAGGGFFNVFKLQNGGVVLYGGIFGALVAVYPYIRAHRLPYRKLLDQAAIALPLGILIGRIGDLVIGDHLGGPTSFFLGYRYLGSTSATVGPPGCPVAPALGFQNGPLYCPSIGQVVHQTALYDFVSAALLFPLMIWVGRKERRTGFLITVAAAWYATGRLVVDFTRTTTATYVGLRGTQWVSVTLVALALVGLARMARTSAAAADPAPSPGPLAWTDAAEGSELMVAEGGPVPGEQAPGPDPVLEPPGDPSEPSPPR